MKKLSIVMIWAIVLFSCKNKHEQGSFMLKGDIRNIADQQIYLEQLYFSQKDPDVLDTAEIKNGKFELSATAPEEGLFRLRLEKIEHGFIFINDRSQITFNTDIKDVSLDKTDFNTPANTLLKRFLVNLDDRSKAIAACSVNVDSLKTGVNSDSLQAIEKVKLSRLENEFKNFIVQFIDTVSDPVIAMFALGYTRDIDPAALKTVIPNMSKRFPNHTGVSQLVTQYNQFVQQEQRTQSMAANTQSTGSMAPELTMNDVNGKAFSLSSLKGKYVLVDFWASWCGPCRGENPNVVEAYNKYKDRNFTVLGVSLDEDKVAWLKAIKDDGLVWQQISDLKGWNSAAVPLFGFDAIPYNVLIDPQGKIIATALRGGALDTKLAEILQ